MRRALGIALAASLLALAGTSLLAAWDAANVPPMQDVPARHPAPTGWWGGPHPAAAPAPHPLLPVAHADHYIACPTSSRITWGTAPWTVPSFISPNGTYGIDDVIGIHVDLVHWDVIPRTITSEVSHSSILLETGEVDRFAVYDGHTSGRVDAHVNYTYTVQEGDHSDDLDYASQRAMYWGTGFTVSSTHDSRDCHLSTPGTSDYRSPSLSVLGDIVVDGILPRVDNVTTSAPPGPHGAGSRIVLTVNFNETVAYSGAAPQLRMSSGGAAEYSSGNGTNALNFTYLVRGGEVSAGLDYAGIDALTTRGMLRDIVGNPANLTLPAPGANGSLVAPRKIAIDGTNATAYATDVSSPDADGAYGVGTAVNITVAFNRAVVVEGGEPRLLLATSPPGHARYAGGSGTAELEFEYRVRPGDLPADLDYANASALVLDGGAAIRSPSDGTAAVLALAAPGTPGSLGHSKNMAIDGVPPRLLGVSSPNPDGTYGTGRIAGVAVEFSEPVAVEGEPAALSLDTAPPRSATYAGIGAAGHPEFLYTVQPGDSADDLGYTATAVLSFEGATVRDLAGNPAAGSLSLPAPGAAGSLSNSSDIVVYGAKLPVLAAAGDIRGNADDARAVAAFEMGGRTYAAVASEGNDGVQLVRVHGNGTLSAVDWINGSRSVSGPNSLAVLAVGGSTYIVATSWGDRAVQVIGVNGSGSLSDVGRANQGPDFDLGGPVGVASFKVGGGTYVIVASAWPTSGVEVIRVNASGGLEQVQWISENDNGQLLLDGAFDADVFEMPVNDTHTATYAIVAAGQEDDGVQLFRVNASDGTLAPARQLGETNSSALELEGARSVDAFRTANNRTYAIVASYNDAGVQLIRVHENGTLEAAGRLSDGGDLALNGAIAVEAFDMGGRTYAAVASEHDDGVQLIRVHEEDGTLSAAGVVRGGPGFPRLDGAHGIDVFGMEGRTYAIVPSRYDHGVQLIRISPPYVANVTVSTPDGSTLSTGRQFNVTVSFDEPVLVSGPPPSLLLAFDGGDRAASYLDGNGTSKIVFSYTLQAGDRADRLEYAGPAALTTRGVIGDARGAEGAAAADLELPARGEPGSLGSASAVRIVDVPYVRGVFSPDAGHTYGTGRIVAIEAVIDRAVTVHGGEPTLQLNTVPPRNAAYAGGNGTDRLEFRYAVMPGDWADRLDYAGTDALSLPEGGYASYEDGRAAADLPPLPPPGAPGSLAPPGSGPIVVVGGPLPILRPGGSAVHLQGYDMLFNAAAVDAFNADDGGAYALVAASGDSVNHGLQMVRVHPNGTLSAVDSIVADGNSPLYQPKAVAAFEMGGRDRALVPGGDSVSLIDVYPNGTIALNSSATDGDGRGFDALRGAASASVFRAGGLTRAIVASQNDDGLQLVRILPNGTLVHNGSAADGEGGLELSGASDVDMLGTDGLGAGRSGPPRAIVSTNQQPGGLQLVSIHPNGTISHNGSATDGEGGFETLRSASSVAAFEMGGLDYAVATSSSDNGVQLVRIHPNGTLAAADSATNGTGGFDTLGFAQDAAVFRMDGWAYAIVASWRSDGLQLVRIDRGGSLVAAGSARDVTGGFDALDGAEGAAVFDAGNRTYALAAAQGDDAVQLVRLSPVSVDRVSSTAGGGPHTAGSMINITVAFDERVVLEDPRHPPSLLLSLDDADARAAPYLSGSGTNKLVFNHTVLPGDATAPAGSVLEYAHAGALVSRGAITDMRGDPADLELPEPGAPGSLSGGRSIITIDTAPPYAVSVSSPNASGTYAPGDVVHIAVRFSEAVDVVGTPILGLALDGEDPNARYSAGSGTAVLAFLYTVRAGDEAADLAHAGALSLAGGSSSIRDAVDNDAIEALPAPGRVLPPGGSGAIAIDGVGPQVAGVAEAEPGKGAPYRAGEAIRIAVDFGEPVVPSANFNSSLRLALAVGETATAWYEGPSGDRRALVHSYTVRDGDAADPLDYDGGSGALAIAGGSVTDELGNPAAAGALALPDPGGDGSLAASGIRIDTERPRALSAAPTNASGTYGIDSDIGIAVLFGEDVYVSGTPRIALNTGAGDGAAARQAVYVSGSGSTALVFVYTVLPGDQTSGLEYAGTGALGLHGGTIRDEAGNGAVLALPAPGTAGSLGGSGTIIAIDAAAPPPPGVPTRVVSVSSPDGSGPHGAGSAVNITVYFSRPVRAEGDLALALSTVPPRSAVRAADGSGGGASHELALVYAVQPGDSADRLDYAGTGALSIVGAAGPVRDTAGNNANLALPEPGSSHSLYRYNIGIDGVAPAARSVDSPTADGTYGIGSTIVIRVLFDEAVYVAGSPLIGMNTGGDAVYASGGGTARLVFEYTVLPGDRTDDLDYAGMLALDLNGGSIQDAAGNGAVLSLPAPGTAGSLGASADIAIDTASSLPPPGEAARVLRVSSPDAGGTYGPGSAVNITVYFSRPVRAEGDLALALSTVPPRSAVRAADAAGDAAGDAGASYNLALVYAVQPGDFADRLDYAGTGALSIVGAAGSVRDADGSDADLALPEPGLPQSLSGSGIAIGAGRDPLPPGTPVVVSVNVRAPAASYVAGETIAIDVVFSAPVSVGAPGGAAPAAAAAAALPYLELRTGSAGARAGYASGSGTDTIRFEYTVRGGDITDRLSYAGTDALRLGGGAIAAAGSGLAASTALPAPAAPGSLSAPGIPVVRIDPEPGRPVLDVGILDDEAGGGAGGVPEAALAAAYAFNEKQGRSPDALLINATTYDAGTAAAAAALLQAAHAGGAGPFVYVGPSTDRGLHAAMRYAADHGIVLVSAGSTAPSLAVEDDTVFRLSPGGLLDAEALARLARSAEAQSMIAVLENATHGPPTSAGTSLDDATPPPQDRFSRAFDAALDYVGVPTLSGTITLEGGAAGGEPYAAAAAAEALNAAAAAARSSRVAVVYAGSPDGLAALAAEASASYPALASATWIASGQSAGSLLLVGDGPAAAFAAQAGLQAVRWSTPTNDLARAVDSLLPPGADTGTLYRAYAAYDAMGVISAAAAAAAADTRGDTPDAAAVAELVPGTAAAYDGALGDIALDYAGDLWVPAVYDLWTVGAQPVSGAEAEWTLQQGALDETRACSIALTRAKIDYGPIDSGQTSRPHLQTIVNTGQLPFSRVDLTATPWHVDSPGSCAPGSMPSLPVGLSEIRTVAGGQFSDLAGSGTVLAQGLEAGSRSPLWYRLSLAGYADLPQAEITQCATYVVRCG